MLFFVVFFFFFFFFSFFFFIFFFFLTKLFSSSSPSSLFFFFFFFLLILISFSVFPRHFLCHYHFIFRMADFFEVDFLAIARNFWGVFKKFYRNKVFRAYFGIFLDYILKYFRVVENLEYILRFFLTIKKN